MSSRVGGGASGVARGLAAGAEGDWLQGKGWGAARPARDVPSLLARSWGNGASSRGEAFFQRRVCVRFVSIAALRLHLIVPTFCFVSRSKTFLLTTFATPKQGNTNSPAQHQSQQDPNVQLKARAVV